MQAYHYKGEFYEDTGLLKLLISYLDITDQKE